MKLRLVLLSFFLLITTSSVFAGTPNNVEVVNVNDRTYTVVWYTEQKETGSIEWWNTSNPSINVAYDLRGSQITDNIHIVQVTKLTKESEYAFRIKSGGVIASENYIVNTGKQLNYSFGTLLTMRNIFKLDPSVLVSNDVIIFSRLVNADNQASLPQAIIYINSYNDLSFEKGYQNYFDLKSYRDVSGNLFSSSSPKKIELLAWTASEGFGNILTINYAPASIDIYLNTANLVYYPSGSTTNPIIPTIDPIVPTPNPFVTINGLLVEDFETGVSDLRINKLGGNNYYYNNSSTIINSRINTIEGANNTTQSYKMQYILGGAANDIYSGYGLNLSANKEEVDLTKYGAIVFFARGVGQLAVELEATTDVISDFNQFIKPITLSNNWQEYVISLSYFAQENWGTKVDLMTALQRIVALKFKAYPQVADPSLKSFEIDEIYLVTGDMGSGITSDPITYPKDLVIADFQNGTGQNSWGGYNYSYDDKGTPNFGNSEVTMNIINESGSKFALVSYDVNPDFTDMFVGVGFGLDVSVNNSQDISRFTGIKFRAKGSATINVEVNSSVYSDYDKHSNQVIVANNGTWNTYYVYFTDMSQEGWGSKVELIEVLKKALAVQFKIGKTNDKGQINIDDIEFFVDGTPNVVQNLTAEVVANSAVLNWDSSIGANSYYVVRNVTNYPNPGTFPVTASFSSPSTTGNTFSEVLEEGKVYYYSVFAYNDLTGFSDATKASKFLRILPVLSALSSIITVDKTILYTQNGSTPISIRNGDYVNSSLTLIVTIDSNVASIDKVIKYIVRVGNDIITSNFQTISANSEHNRFYIPVTLDAGINNLEVLAIDWMNDTSNTVIKTVVVAEETSVVTLKPGSKLLCSPMPYNPDSINPMHIAYELTVASDVEIYIYNLLGQVVWKNLYYKGFEGGNAGYNQISFNGVDAFNDKLAIGMYFIQIVHGKSVLGTSKFLVTR